MSKANKETQQEVSTGNLRNIFIHDILNAKFATTNFLPQIAVDPRDTIRINVSTPGGDVATSFVIKEMLESRHQDIVVIATSRIASAGWYLFTSDKYLRLTYANTVWFQHSPSYSLADIDHEEAFSALPTLVNQSQTAHKEIAETTGMSINEVTRLFDSKTIYFTGMETIWLGTKGIVDGIIFKEINPSNWIILTREGLKLAHTSDTPETIRKAALLTDEYLEQYGLKQFVPTPPKRPSFKTMVSGLDYLTKQESKNV
ncbi:ATP-dependent Clp protease proteolytic subunit [Aeromonas phage ZPAH34]|uniref:head maturation protease n=1 Tax=Aeromonas phage ZPAH34 TaxID=2924888 RepID=UPI0023297C7E|nr:head maturation protease [Aeromonas phage ZPAH34]UOX39507.1 ATP-dependent Clp protease proteolytic subunit [Aeromonas phage ZPAH34]